MKTQMDVTRRRFIQASALTGVGFMVGCSTNAPQNAAATAEAACLETDKLIFNHFVKVCSDNTVTVVIKHLDKGQGVTTGLTAIVAEELGADWDQMRWEFAVADAKRYNNLLWGPAQGTGGSTAIANSWMQLRQAGASAKHMLIQAAANTWQVPAAEILLDQGKLLHPSGKTAAIGDMAIAASQLIPPQNPPLKDPKDFTLIGHKLPRIDSREKSTGKAQYTIDVKRPNMLNAAIVHPPRFGAKAVRIDDSQAKAMPGVSEVINTPRGVAIIADSYWTALQAKQRLNIQWDFSQAENRSSAQLHTEMNQLARKAGTSVKNRGDFNAALSSAAKTIELNFEFPYLAHATMEPMNCVVELTDSECHIWTGCQIPTADKWAIKAITGLPLEKIFIHTQFAGGSFGRRAVPDSDYVAEAVMIAKAMNNKQPVKLQWSREDDMKAGRYRPMAHHQLTASLDSEGNISGWRQRVVSQALLRGTPFEAMITGPIDVTMTEGATQLPYQIPHFAVEGTEVPVGVPVLWWRSVGHTFNGYVTEVFFDELAHAAKKDPVAWRMDLLKDHPRHQAVLKLAADKSGWGEPLPKGKARGVALHESFSTIVAQVAEITLNSDGSYKVDKVTCAVDCGIAITPDVVRAQMEGGIGFGLSAIIGEKVTLNNGEVVQSNFHDYTPLRIQQMPDIDVHIVPSAEAPTGVGEPGTPPIGPAVANALRVLTGKPITQLPIGPVVS
ncbi:xanthine dehydrogenase family protein molybdopterin-binding subunit [Maricurvus nonylphenolicus]|uniref:xanthine dehydrogenase family protein molybdopterin-binding subunit n=1 Tax=Maricurvus nonylphenolicus TaxID=1008307 RepID=UPI0036F244FD